jgi:hypothetical protein
MKTQRFADRAKEQHEHDQNAEQRLWAKKFYEFL